MADESSGRAAHLLSLVRSVIPPIHRGGIPVIGSVAGATLAGRTILRAAGLPRPARWLTRTGLWVTAASAAFFRAPVRINPTDRGVVVAPADGVVALIQEASPPAELAVGIEPRLRVSIFLSVLDVHVQRIPMTGWITAVAYHPGKFLSADLDKASEENERNSLAIADSDLGTEVVVTQIAGLLARRIVSSAALDSSVRLGDTYGLIRFGSRGDTYLPLGTELSVLVGLPSAALRPFPVPAGP